jgi:hypothetical protein
LKRSQLRRRAAHTSGCLEEHLISARGAGAGNWAGSGGMDGRSSKRGAAVTPKEATAWVAGPGPTSSKPTQAIALAFSPGLDPRRDRLGPRYDHVVFNGNKNWKRDTPWCSFQSILRWRGVGANAGQVLADKARAPPATSDLARAFIVLPSDLSGASDLSQYFPPAGEDGIWRRDQKAPTAGRAYTAGTLLEATGRFPEVCPGCSTGKGKSNQLLFPAESRFHGKTALK